MATTNAAKTKKVILSIEPDYLMQVYIRKKIKRQGLLVNLASNYAEALELLHANTPVDRVIMDTSDVNHDMVVFLRQLKLQNSDNKLRIYASGCTDHAKFLAQLKKEKIDPAVITGFLDDLMEIDTVIEDLSTKTKA